MNISSVVAPSYAARTAPAVGNLYSAIAASDTSNAAASAKTSTGPDAVVTLSSKALELMRLRQVSDEATQQFKDIIAKANALNAQTDPKAFLNSLSVSDMEVLRKVHCLAETINVPSLTSEGAANLLVQPGSEQDLNNDGLTTTGAGNSFTFPPANAPESFKAAWASATDGMSFADIPTEMIFAVGLANIGREPGDPNWVNPYADANYDYKAAVSNITSSLKYEYASNLIPQKQFQQETGFYSRLSQALG